MLQGLSFAAERDYQGFNLALAAHVAHISRESGHHDKQTTCLHAGWCVRLICLWHDTHSCNVAARILLHS